MPDYPFISIDASVGSIYRPLTSTTTSISEFNEEPVGIKTFLVLALPFDENTGFTDIAPAMRVDRTVADKTVNPFNGVGISSAQGTQPGRSSASFDGTNDYFTIPYDNTFNFGTGNFTIECWFRLNNIVNYYVLGGTVTSITTDEWLIQTDGSGNIRFLTSAGTSFYTAGLVANTWYHFAAVRNGTTVTTYINGSSIGSYTNSNSIGSVSKTLYIGMQSGTHWPTNGYIQDFRIYNGYAKYTANFTPPARLTGGFGATRSSTTSDNARHRVVVRETGISTNKFSVPPRITKYVDVNQVTQNPRGFPYTISPALPDGSTSGDFASGLTIVGVGTTGRGYTLTPGKDMTVVVKMWGAGGGRYFDGSSYTTNSGAGGASYGRVTLTGGTSYLVFAGGTGRDSASVRGAPGGGAASGIVLASDQSEILIAGGGAGSYGVPGGGRASGAGGVTTGQDGEGATTGGDGGTQTAGGAGGAGGRRTGATATNTNGAGGATGSALYFGGYSGIASSNGAPKYNGGVGDLNSGDAGSPGGGGGHFGGGQGGGDGGAFGSGGGSGYYNPAVVVGIGTTILYRGTGATPGNSSDTTRGTYGDVGQPGLVYLSLI